ncbi:putative NIF3 family protein [Prevotella sp. CAG:604]|nr:putative NIF3 family protein [Prevotella sp. CAG:604]
MKIKYFKSVKIYQVVDALEHYAPLPLQEGYDNAGLQVGLTEAVEVSGALLCLDVTEDVVDEAIRKGCNLIVSHHPLIFRKLARISDENYVQRTVRKAIKNDIAIVSMHTNMDAAKGGVNFKIAEKLGLRNLRFFGGEKEIDGVKGGEGVIGEITDETDALHADGIAADDLVLMLRERFQAECVQCNQLLRRPIRKVALCGGAGSFLLDAAIAAGADAFITGEMHYHEFFGHEQEIQICVIGHYQSEQFTSEIFRSIITEKCPGVKCEISEINTNPIIYL